MTTEDRFRQMRQSPNANDKARDAEIQEQISEHKIRVERVKRFKRFRKDKHIVPLDFLAIGDSWFKYPLYENLLIPPYDFGIVAKHKLQSIGNPSPIILNQAWPGQASTAVLSYKNQEAIIQVLEDGEAWLNGKGPDAILVSMGGDDIAGDQFAIYVEYGGVGGLSKRFNGVLDLVSASYADLFDLRDKFAPGVPIFGHCYDYAVPNGVPAALILGPWLKPSFDFALYSPKDAQAIVQGMIDQFYKMLNGFTKSNFHLVDTRKTIDPNTAYPHGWSNEIHPHDPGFTLLAKKFLVALRGHFPKGRI